MSLKGKNLSEAVGFFEKGIEGTIRKIPLKDIRPAVNQPRLNKDINIDYLARSLETEGLLQPILVTKIGDTFTIIAGERRFRAASLLGWLDIECKILNKNQKETYKIAVIENLQRENLDSFEESLSYKTLKEHYSYTDIELSEILGKSRSYIAELLTIADIPEDIKNKAEQIGINSKNMLIQLAQATKNNIEQDFLNQVENSSITSVKDAKNFIQFHKNETPINTPNSVLDKSDTPKKEVELLTGIHVKVKQNKNNNLIIHIETQSLSQKVLSTKELEQNITNYIQQYIDSLN